MKYKLFVRYNTTLILEMEILYSYIHIYWNQRKAFWLINRNICLLAFSTVERILILSLL